MIAKEVQFPKFTAAMIKVISKREPQSEPAPKKEHGGLFRDVKFDPTAEPKQRVRFDRANANIVIATKAPSVAAYLDEQGNGSQNPQGQVLLAELVAEAVCFEIARRGVENGVFLAPNGAEADAMRREHVNLQNKYAHKIHECFVDAQHRRVEGETVMRKGRPPRSDVVGASGCFCMMKRQYKFIQGLCFGFDRWTGVVDGSKRWKWRGVGKREL